MIKQLFTVIQFLLIVCFAIFSPAIAIILSIYNLVFLQFLQSRTKVWAPILMGFILVILNLWKFNYHELVNVGILNLSFILQITRWPDLVINSFVNFKITAINNGLVGLSGIYFIINGLINKRILNSKLNENKNVHVDKEIIDGVIFGNDSNSNIFKISHHELNQHALVIGTTGSGKTCTLLNIVHNCCEQNLPLIYLDGKGSIQLANKINEICNKFNRKLKIFSIDPNQEIPNLSKYNPLAYGNFTEWKNKISTLLGEAENKGQEHYATQEQNYINLVCEILNKSNKPIDFEAFLAYLSHPEELQKLANNLGPEISMRLLNNKSNNENNDIVKTLELFYHSHYGNLFSTTGISEDNIINLQKSITNNEIVLFLFDAASYKRDTSLLGKLVINDINSAFSGLGRSGISTKAYCIFDEFAAYASANMANVLAMQRSNGMHAIIGTQSIHAISEESQQIKRVAVELIANCNTFMIHKINDAHDIELLQRTIGTETRYKLHSINGQNIDESKVNAVFSDDYILDGNNIRKLTPGFGYVCQTVLGQSPQLVKFNYI